MSVQQSIQTNAGVLWYSKKIEEEKNKNMKGPTEELWVAVSRQKLPDEADENMSFAQRIVTGKKGKMKEKGALKRHSVSHRAFQ